MSTNLKVKDFFSIYIISRLTSTQSDAISTTTFQFLIFFGLPAGTFVKGWVQGTVVI